LHLIAKPFDDPDWLFEPKFDGQVSWGVTMENRGIAQPFTVTMMPLVP